MMKMMMMMMIANETHSLFCVNFESEKDAKQDCLLQLQEYTLGTTLSHQ